MERKQQTLLLHFMMQVFIHFMMQEPPTSGHTTCQVKGVSKFSNIAHEVAPGSPDMKIPRQKAFRTDSRGPGSSEEQVTECTLAGVLAGGTSSHLSL